MKDGCHAHLSCFASHSLRKLTLCDPEPSRCTNTRSAWYRVPHAWNQLGTSNWYNHYCINNAALSLLKASLLANSLADSAHPVVHFWFIHPVKQYQLHNFGTNNRTMRPYIYTHLSKLFLAADTMLPWFLVPGTWYLGTSLLRFNQTGNKITVSSTDCSRLKQQMEYMMVVILVGSNAHLIQYLSRKCTTRNNDESIHIS